MIDIEFLKKTSAATAAILVAMSGAAWSEEVTLEFGSLVAFGMVEQDVFVDAGGGEVRRIAAKDVENMMDAPLFGAAVSPPFQPQYLEPTEIYGMGIDLDMTLREWLGASASGSMTCQNDVAQIDISLAGLQPNAVYTMWNFIDAEPPTDPWQGILHPLGARDGSDATFNTDADGNAQYEAAFSPCPEESGTQTLTGIAVAWHPDGKTHGASPGSMGVDTFSQLMAAFVH